MINVCILICVSFGFTQTVPLNFRDPFFPNYDSGDYSDMVRATRNLIPKLGSESLLLKTLESNSYPNDGGEYRDGEDFIRLPTQADDFVMLDQLPRSAYFENGIQASLPREYGLITQNVPSPMVWNGNYMPYETDEAGYEANLPLTTGAVNLEVDPYEVDLYPFVHTSIAAALNPVPPVENLPPVYATQIHEKMPSLETRADFDIDVLNPENSEQMPPNLRITRSRRDFLEDLSHDAMLNNLLPTMPVPFVRGAEVPRSYQASQPAPATGQVLAVYPSGVLNNCAIPVLLRCSPNIIRGTLSSNYVEQSPQVTSGVAYRKGAGRINQNALRQINV